MSVLDIINSVTSGDPSAIDPELRKQVAEVLHARSELLAAQSEVAGLRTRLWAGEENLDVLIEVKMAGLTKLRKAHGEKLIGLLKNSVDLDGLLEELPGIGMTLLSKLNIPLPVLLEVIGADFDAIKVMIDGFKELAEEL